MPWLPMYLLKEDVEFFNDWLNQEEEIAFLVSNGSKRWIAKKEHNILADVGKQSILSDEAALKFSATDKLKFCLPNFAEYQLWHVPSGPLPLLEATGGVEKLRVKKEDWDSEGKVSNPWLGWTEHRTGANHRVPYFGSGHPGVFHLEIKLPHEKEIPISAFSWIGNHYKNIGNGAEPVTELFWKKLRGMVKKIATQIPRCDNPGWKKEIFAFPNAHKEIMKGRSRALNP